MMLIFQTEFYFAKLSALDTNRAEVIFQTDRIMLFKFQIQIYYSLFYGLCSVDLEARLAGFYCYSVITRRRYASFGAVNLLGSHSTQV